MDVHAFVTARLDEWEATAQAASPSPWTYGDVDSVAGGTLYDKTRSIASVVYEQRGDHDGTIVRHLLWPEADRNGRHIAAHDPASVLAEVAALRAVVDDLAARRFVRFKPGDEDPFPGGVTVMDGRAYWPDRHGADVTDAFMAWQDERAEIDPDALVLLRHLAGIWADHPDYRQEWKP